MSEPSASGPTPASDPTPDPPGWDKPYPKEWWDAFLQDLEDDTQQYISEVVDSLRKADAHRQSTTEPAGE